MLGEIADGRDFGFLLAENELPHSPGARAVSEMLGLDLLHVASEGRMLAIVSEAIAAELLAAWQQIEEGSGAREIGAVTADAGRVILETSIGGRRLVDIPQGELLPRIC